MTYYFERMYAISRKIFITCLSLAMCTFCFNMHPADAKSLYSLNRKYIKKAEEKLNYKVAVIVFDDTRPQIEKSAKERQKNFIPDASFYTEDRVYTGNKDNVEKSVAFQISKMIARHINYARLFKKVDFVDVSKQKFIEARGREALQGYDLVLLGDIKHFYGYYRSLTKPEEDPMGHIINSAIGGAIIGGFLGAMEEGKEKKTAKKIEGYTYLKDVRLSTTDTSTIVWQGEVKNRFKDIKKKYLSSAYKEANISLRNAINDFIGQLEKTNIDINKAEKNADVPL